MCPFPAYIEVKTSKYISWGQLDHAQPGCLRAAPLVVLSATKCALFLAASWEHCVSTLLDHLAQIFQAAWGV